MMKIGDDQGLDLHTGGSDSEFGGLDFDKEELLGLDQIAPRAPSKNSPTSNRLGGAVAASASIALHSFGLGFGGQSHARVGPASQQARFLAQDDQVEVLTKRQPGSPPVVPSTYMLPEDGLDFWQVMKLDGIAPKVILRGDAYLPKEMKTLSQPQRFVNNHLRAMLSLHLERRLYPNPRPEARVFNEATWGRIIASLILSLGNEPSSISDCWYSSARTDKSGYPQIHISPGDVDKRGNQGTRFFSNVGESDRVLVKAAKLGWMLGHPIEMETYTIGDRTSQVDHLCGNNLCFNPFCLGTAADQENKSRHGCRYGCAAFCVHKGRCKFSNAATGKALLCLNSLDLGAVANCVCVQSCKEYLEHRRAEHLH